MKDGELSKALGGEGREEYDHTSQTGMRYSEDGLDGMSAQILKNEIILRCPVLSCPLLSFQNRHGSNVA